MGFLKRLFSIGSKKSKKNAVEGDPNQLRRHHTQTLPVVLEDSEVAASRLLRSASARFAVSSTPDNEPHPHLPHPINDLPATPSLPPTRTSTMKSRGTYSVKVLERTLHSRTEFPNANPSFDTPSRKRSSIPMPEDHDNDMDDLALPHNIEHPPITPRDQSRLLRLRQDPSVASLLNMYDEHGCLDSNVFSNSPPSDEGRPQRRRTGSTLRQLMGDPSSDDGSNGTTNEGDISWAERFLDRQSLRSASIASAASSSFGTRTPEDPPYAYDHSHDNGNATTKHVTFLSQNDSSETSSVYPVFSSLEVELSGNLSATSEKRLSATNYSHIDPAVETTQRASQVFQFLTEKRKPRKERSLPALPTTVVSSGPAVEEVQPLFPDTVQEQTPAHMEPNTKELRELDFVSRIPRFRQEHQTLRPIMNGEAAALVTAARIPPAKGPRRLRHSTISLAELPDTYKKVGVGTQDGSMQLRSHSRKSPYVEPNMAFIMSPEQERRHVTSDMDGIRCKGSRVRPGPFYTIDDKENSCSTYGLPKTPVRSQSVLSAGGNDVAVSPASSTEMSPIGQQIMADARKQRHRP